MKCRMKIRLSALLPFLLVLLLAFALRCYRLDAQSFWNDEGNSARIAERPVALILAGAAADIHPPGYYLLLHTWRALAGHTEFALRYLSVMASVLAVAFTGALGRRLCGTIVGWGAALGAALAPLAIYYAQEARMYAWLQFLSVAATYFLVSVLSHPEQSPVVRRSWVAYGLLAAAGLYVQYAFPFILLVHNGIFALWWMIRARPTPHRWRWLVAWLGLQTGVLLLYLPWLSIALRSVLGWPSAARHDSLGKALSDMLRVLSVGITLPLEATIGELWAAGLLLAFGLLRTPLRRRPADRLGHDRAAMVIYLLLPVTLLLTFNLYKPEWLKFLVVILPPFHILLAQGIANLMEAAVGFFRWGDARLRFLTVLVYSFLLVGIGARSLRNLYFVPAYARDDYRQLAADIAAEACSNDVIILNAPNQWEVFTYYYQGQNVYPAPYHPEPEDVERFLAPLLEGERRRLFVLYWGDAESDPRRLVETALSEWAYKAADRWYGRVRLAIYGVAPLREGTMIPMDIRFGDSIWLRGYRLATTTVAAGEVLPLTIHWETTAPLTERYKVTVQVLDREGQLVAQHDTEPRDGLLPTDRWPPGEVVSDQYGVLLPAGLSSGQYTLLVALYHVSTGERLPVFPTHSDHLLLAEVTVEVP